MKITKYRLSSKEGWSKSVITKLLSLFLLCFPLHSFSENYTNKSILSEGKWIQLQVKENAIYKLTYDDVKKMGFTNPAKIKIYGYGGWPLEQDFTKPYTDDLPEVAVYLNKGSDGIFNSGDYLLFYGHGVIKWTYDTSNDFFTHQNNPYANYGYYFITENEQGPKEMPVQESYSQPTVTVNSFDDYRVHEKDLVALLHSGRELFGESFVGNPSQNFTFKIPGITSETGKVRLSFAAAPKSATPVILSIENETLLSTPLYPVSSDGYQKADKINRIATWNGNKTENVTVNISFSSTGSVANLDYIVLNTKRKLQSYNEACTFFRNKNNRNTAIKYSIENAANLQVWNITDVQNIRRVQTAQEGANLTFGVAAGSIPEYALVDITQSFPSPKVIGEIQNQNLHAFPPTDMVIIAPKVYFSLAEQLAEKHRSLQGLKVAVVQPEWIYNEFSSGTPDATAYRRFMKMFYDRATTDTEKPRYLLLFGDGYFDNRRLTKEGGNLNDKYYLLTYQFENSVNENESYGTDDYFGFLDDWEGVNLGSNRLDIGIGRFPVSTYEQAENVLKKTLNYMDNKNYSAWKNTVIFTADDTDPNFGYCYFADGADELAHIVEQSYPSYMVVKSYMDAFRPVDVNGQRTYPDAKQKLMNTLKEGCFLFNYTGHGSPTSMSAKDMMNIMTIRQMNFASLPLWITATCDFGRYDDDRISAGEEVLLNKNSAGIALFTTTRVVSGAMNQVLNRFIIRNVFAQHGTQRPALGDILRESKLDLGSDNNKLNFVLIGDPALQLNYPEWEVVLESINDQPVKDNTLAGFRALDFMTLKGVIKDSKGNPMENFNGGFQATIFDGKQTLRPVTSPLTEGQQWSFPDYPNIVYNGNANVENGRFNFSFRVPLDISYTANPGKMNFYAWDKNLHIDAAGSFMNYTLSGTSDNAIWNELGPEIEEMYLNSNIFRNGDKVNETPFFYASVFDEDGINRTGSGLGHGITVCIDNHPAWIYNLNNYFTSGYEFGHGTIGFSIPELPAGSHQLIFKVWDILNNSTVDSLRFTVEKGLLPRLSNVYATPNPAKTITVFTLEHDRPESVLEVELRVYDLTGRMVWSQSEINSLQPSQRIEWDLKNGQGQRVSPGIYVYQAILKTSGGKEATKSKKLIVL
ncbi:peptidase C25 [Bacteroidia bacterium]|nr:peptidase C25 [Bacteroidia bacterium]